MAGAGLRDRGGDRAVTSVQRRAQPTTQAEPTGRQLRRVLVGLIVGDTQIGVVVDAVAPVAMQLAALVDLVNTRLGEIGLPRLESGERGRWALCWVDGTPLRPGRSLAEQGVVDGARLWLRFVDDTEARAPVIEHVTTAVSAELKRHWPGVDALWAARVGAAMVATATMVVLAVLAHWRYDHVGWLTTGVAGGLAAVLLIAALLVALRSRPGYPADLLVLCGALATALAAAAAVPGRVGAPQLGMGSAVVVAAAVLVIRFTGRHVALCTAAIVLATAALVAGVARMLLVTSAVTLLTCLLLVAVLGVDRTPVLARWAAGIRLPVFPSASGRWIFETRPDLPSAVVVAGGENPVMEGPESVRDVVVATDRAHSYLTGLLTGFCGLLVISCVGLCDPHADRRCLPLVLSGVVAAAVLLQGRSYTDRWQATVLAVTSVTIVVGVSLRYVIGLWSTPALLIGCAVILAVPAAGLIAAVVVPQHIYTPVFRQLVEWLGYALLVAVFPLAFWLMNVFAAIRYR